MEKALSFECYSLSIAFADRLKLKGLPLKNIFLRGEGSNLVLGTNNNFGVDVGSDDGQFVRSEPWKEEEKQLR